MNCNKCNTELVVGENWYKSYQKNHFYICKICQNSRVRKWQKENVEKHESHQKKSRKKNGKKYYSSLLQKKKNYIKKEGIGVYLVKYRWLNFYVGEGQLYNRRSEHLSIEGKKGGITSRSKVANIIKQRNLPRKYLSFHVLEYEDDKTRMLELENKYRRELKPYLNPL